MDTDLSRWLGPQKWRHDLDRPVLALGEAGAFDDAHMFAPCVTFEDDVYRLWYCGSQGTVEGRVFRLGLAESRDGVHFTRYHGNPVAEFGDGCHSILTSTLLRHPDGSLLREDGTLRMWFVSAHFAAGDGRHTLHDMASEDGIHWSSPSPPQLENIYAPTVLFEDGLYRLWYIDVAADPWSIRYAESGDGREWRVDAEPVVVLDQAWEHGRLFYPVVLKADGVYLMWYGSYTQKHPEMMTAMGLAVSEDGRRWHKNPHNPVIRPVLEHSWESNFATSGSVLRLADDRFRGWFATRTSPPTEHKYFAISTAVWDGPEN